MEPKGTQQRREAGGGGHRHRQRQVGRRRHVAHLVVSDPLPREDPGHAIGHVRGEEEDVRPRGQRFEAQAGEVPLVAGDEGLHRRVRLPEVPGQEALEEGSGALVPLREGAQRRLHFRLPGRGRDGPSRGDGHARERGGEAGRRHRSPRDRGDGAEVLAGEDTELVEPPQGAEMEQGGAETAAREAQPDALAGRAWQRPVPRGRLFVRRRRRGCAQARNGSPAIRRRGRKVIASLPVSLPLLAVFDEAGHPDRLRIAGRASDAADEAGAGGGPRHDRRYSQVVQRVQGVRVPLP